MAGSLRPSAPLMAAWRALLVAHTGLIDRLDTELRQAHDLPLDWYDVLFQLAEAGGHRSMGELAGALLIAPSNCTRLVDRMVDSGLVERRRGATDTRVVEAVLTPRGRRLQRRAAVTHLQGIQEYFGSFIDDSLATALSEALEASIASCRVSTKGS